eukprot:Phypoly_transcript_13310.p1 GENE.Phypoly_transcript_13310~~Phypoly_transcript_13310.p1  ORF type:complete len:313 (+),score=32.97 Phypoly_transcript_13310:64-1002(+)
MSSTYIISLFIFLLSVSNIILQVSSATLYGIIDAPGGEDLVSIDNATGNFTIVVPNTDADYSGLEESISCFDQINKVFYYVTLKALFPLDTQKRTLLPLIKYGSALATSCHCDSTNLLIAMASSEMGYVFVLVSYPLAPNTGAPKILANLQRDDNITYAQGQAYDPVHNIFYSIEQNDSDQHTLVLHRVDLNNPDHATQALFPCTPKVLYLTYDPVQNAVVGIGGNFTAFNNTIESKVYAFVVNDDGSCTLSQQIPDISYIISAITYDPYTSTFYLCSVYYDGAEIFMFNTKTSKVTTLEIDGILDYMEVAY